MQSAFRNARGRKESEGSELARVIDSSLAKTDSGVLIPSRVIQEPGLIKTYGQGYYDVGNRWFKHRFFSQNGLLFSTTTRFIREEWQHLSNQSTEEEVSARVDSLGKLAAGMHIGEGALFPQDILVGKTVGLGFSEIFLLTFVDHRLSPAAAVFLAGLSDLSNYSSDQMVGFKAFVLQEFPPTDRVRLPQTFSPADQWFFRN